MPTRLSSIPQDAASYYRITQYHAAHKDELGAIAESLMHDAAEGGHTITIHLPGYVVELRSRWLPCTICGRRGDEDPKRRAATCGVCRQYIEVA